MTTEGVERDAEWAMLDDGYYPILVRSCPVLLPYRRHTRRAKRQPQVYARRKGHGVAVIVAVALLEETGRS